MAFSRAAQNERRMISSGVFRETMLERGWCEALAPIAMLEELGIPWDRAPGMESSFSRYSTNVSIYAPAWVYGVIVNMRSAEVHTYNQIRWELVRNCLMRTRDSLQEQEMVSSELSLNIDIKRSIRDAARHYTQALQKAHKQ